MHPNVYIMKQTMPLHLVYITMHTSRCKPQYDMYTLMHALPYIDEVSLDLLNFNMKPRSSLHFSTDSKAVNSAVMAFCMVGVLLLTASALPKRTWPTLLAFWRSHQVALSW